MGDIKSKIILRNDTAANWTTANPVLSKGEIGVEIDTYKFKIGDGVANWSSISYFVGAAGGAITITSITGDLSFASGVLSYTGPAAVTTSANGLMIYTDKVKLDGISSGAQVNVIETVKVNGVAQSVTSKAVDITVPSTFTISNVTGLQTALDGKLNLSGGTLTGALTLSGAPSSDLHASTKKYVDDGLATKATTATTLAGYGITNAYTKTEIDSTVTTLQGQISGAFHYKGTKADMTALNAVVSPSNGDVYQVTTGANGTNAEYVWNGTAWEELGTTIDLSTYATQTYVSTGYVAKDGAKVLTTNDLTNALKTNYDTAYTHSQSAHAPSTAQANVLEAVQINGSAMTITSKTVNIPVATTTVLGVTKSSTASNAVAVDAAGVMTVNNLSVDRLLNGASALILNGGNATTT